MATLQKLRNQAGLLVAIVIFIALAAFILGDLLKSGSSIIRGKQLEIAQIDGESIEYPDFQERFNEIANVYKQNNQTNNLDDAAYQKVLNQTWDDIVQKIIMTKVYDDLGIEITSEEMFDMVQGNNLHPIIRQVFGDPQTGQVDKSQIIKFLKYIQENPDAPQKESWLNIEKEILKAKKQSKYNDLVAKGLYANSLQAKQSLEVKGKVAGLKFIQKKFTTVPDSTVAVTENDLKKYYDEHLDDYEQKAQKTISYVTFNISPSAQDEKDVVKWISDIKAEFEKATDNVQFVNMNADTRFEDVYDKKDMLSPELGEWAFNAEVGEVYGPYKEGMVYKLAKLNAIKMLPDSVKASHILIRVEKGADPKQANTIIDSLKNVIESGMATFEQVAKDNSQDGSATLGGDLGWFKRGMMVAPFERAAFRADINEVVKVQTQFGFHLIKVTAQSKKSKNVQLAILDREIIASTSTYQNVYAEASRFAANAQNLKGFNDLVAKEQKSPRMATLSENDRQVTGLGTARPLVRAAFNTDQGDLVLGNDNSPVFELDDKFVIAALAKEQEEGTKEFSTVKSAIELAVIKEKKSQMVIDEFTKAESSSIDETASKLGLTVETADGFNLSFGSVNAIGYEPVINGAAAALKVDEQSKPIAGRNGVYIIELTSLTGGDENTDIEAEKLSLYKNASYRANYQAYQTLKDNSDIVDKRSKFY